MPNDTPGAIAAAREREELMTGEMTFIPDPMTQYAPKHVIYIFNVGPKEHVVEKGSAGPRGGYKIEACEKGQQYSRPLILPSIVTDTFMFENEIRTHSVAGEFQAQDIVHPMLGNNWSFGQNLDDLGVFWTKNNPPTETEVLTARTRLEKTFRNLLAEATQLEATNRLQEITPLMRYAADFFEEDRPWNKIYKKVAECPGCGTAVKPGIVVHTCGAVMPGKWPQAVAMGLKTREQAEQAREATAFMNTEEAPEKAADPNWQVRTGQVEATPADDHKIVGVGFAAKRPKKSPRKAPR